MSTEINLPGGAEPSSLGSVENRTPSRFEFVDEGASLLSTLEIDLAEYVDFFAQASRILFELRVQVVRVEVVPAAPHRLLYRLCLVEFDGARLDERRRRQIRNELLHLLAAPERFSVQVASC